jgi:ABC-type Fe2+-enterobactin transport system substrate-binding protein
MDEYQAQAEIQEAQRTIAELQYRLALERSTCEKLVYALNAYINSVAMNQDSTQSLELAHEALTEARANNPQFLGRDE